MKSKFYNFMLVLTTLLFSNSVVMAATKAQSELKSFGLKFLHIIFCVVVSIVVIFLALIAYKRFKNTQIKIFNNNEMKNSLLSSENLDDAIEHFIKDSE